MAAAAVYDATLRRFAAGELDWENDEIKVMLANDDYQPERATDSVRSDIRFAEVSDSGTYVSGGQTLRGRSISGDVPYSTKLLASSVTWVGFTGNFRYAVIYGTGGDKPLIAYTDLGPQTATNARVTLEYDKDAGVCEFAVAND